MAIQAGNIHPATTQVWQAAEQIRQAIHFSRWQKHRVTEVYDTVGALSELLIVLPQLLKNLVDSLVDTQAESCYHDSDNNVPATLEAIVTHLANTKESLDAITSARFDLHAAHEHLGYLGHVA